MASAALRHDPARLHSHAPYPPCPPACAGVCSRGVVGPCIAWGRWRLASLVADSSASIARSRSSSDCVEGVCGGVCGGAGIVVVGGRAVAGSTGTRMWKKPPGGTPGGTVAAKGWPSALIVILMPGCTEPSGGSVTASCLKRSTVESMRPSPVES